jgi:hypothetical protein
MFNFVKHYFLTYGKEDNNNDINKLRSNYFATEVENLWDSLP